MSKQQLEIANGSYETNELPLSSAICVNAYPVYSENAAFSGKSVIGSPGITQVNTTGDAITGFPRGDIVVNDIQYKVAGTSVFKIFSDALAENIGTIGTGGRVSMAQNGGYLVIVIPGGDAYYYHIATSVFAQITDASYIASDTVTFLDGRFVFTTTDGSIFFCSDLNDPTSYDALNFGTAEASPDNIVAGFVDHGELFIFGVETVQSYANIAGSGFPFQSIGGAVIVKGAHSRNSIVSFDNTMLFLGGGVNEKSCIWRATSSSSVQKVSSNAIDQQIQKFTRDEMRDYSFALTFSYNGAFFAAFTFMAENNRIPSKTFVYDATASAFSGKKIWHELQSGSEPSRWRVETIVQVYNQLYVSDYTDASRIGYLDVGAFKEYNETIIREVITQPFTNNNIGLFYSNLEVTMVTGVGLNDGQGDDPQLRMSFSDDGGRTWSNEISRPMGKIGDYKARVLYRGSLGYAPSSRMFKFIMSDPVKFAIMKVDANVEEGKR